ncbi:hypothetical protein BGZ70_010302, partial [Mortierella alpina]
MDLDELVESIMLGSTPDTLGLFRCAQGRTEEAERVVPKGKRTVSEGIAAPAPSTDSSGQSESEPSAKRPRTSERTSNARRRQYPSYGSLVAMKALVWETRKLVEVRNERIRLMVMSRMVYDRVGELGDQYPRNNVVVPSVAVSAVA